jgi:hypothetical protein
LDGRQAVHHLQTNSIKSMEAPLYLYIRILTVEFTHTTLLLLFFTCKHSGLVVEEHAKPCQESSRVLARAPEVVSEISELLYPYLSL